MRFIFFNLPIVILLLGWLFGRCRITRALACLAVMMTIAETLIVVSLFSLDPFYFLAGLALAPFGIIISVAFSLVTSKQVSPAPVDHMVDVGTKAAEAYDTLSPESKQKVNALARGGAKIGLEVLARHLKKKGHTAGADALRHTAKFI